MLGAAVAPAREVTVRGVPLKHGPHVVLHPSFAPTMGVLRDRLPSPAEVSVSATSTLVVDGPGVVIKSLRLDGALEIRACDGANVRVDNLSVANAGHSIVELSDEEMASEDVPEVLRIRGFRLRSDDGVVVVFDEPGDYVLSDGTIAQFARQK